MGMLVNAGAQLSNPNWFHILLVLSFMFPLCRIAVLEGGLPAWKAAGGPVDTSAADDVDQRPKQAARSGSGSTKYKATLKKDKVSKRALGACKASLCAERWGGGMWGGAG